MKLSIRKLFCLSKLDDSNKYKNFVTAKPRMIFLGVQEHLLVFCREVKVIAPDFWGAADGEH